MHTSLISVDVLMDNEDNPRWRIFDCHFDLDNPYKAAQIYEKGHIPGADFLDLEADLSSNPIPGKTGRHPLPDPAILTARIAQAGTSDDDQIVVYDRQNAAFATRAWWLIRRLGHEAVAVLDGGWNAWLNAGGSIAEGNESIRKPGNFSRRPSMAHTVTEEQISSGDWIVLDARSPERYQGKKDWADPVAGHIPLAINAHFLDNLGADGTFHTAQELRKRYETLLPANDSRPIACYCGSGITATHNLLALYIAGYDNTALYPGSWSAWITDPSRPIARGT